MRELADNGAYALVEQGARLMFFRRAGLVPAALVLLVGLSTFGLAAHGLVAAFVPGWGAAAGPSLLAAALGGAALLVLVRRRRAALARPLDPRDAIVVLDLGAGLLMDGAGTPLAPLARVRFERRVRLFLQQRTLLAVWPGGSRTVHRGDLFVGALDDPVEVLEARGLRLLAGPPPRG